MPTRALSALSAALLIAGCQDGGAVVPTEAPSAGTSRQELIAGAPMTVRVRLIEEPGGKWRLVCLGRFNALGTGDAHSYRAFVTFYEEGAQVAQLGSVVDPLIPTFKKKALLNELTISHPSTNGLLQAQMVRRRVDPRRQHSCQVVVERDGTEVMRSGARVVREVAKPTGAFVHVHQMGLGMAVAVAFGDVNGDGDLDAVLAERRAAGPQNRVRFNDGAFVTTDSGQVLGNHLTRSIALGDVDGDGDLDVFLGNDGQPSRVFVNNGLGAFTDSGQLLASASTRAVALGDLDGDRDLDAVQGNFGQASRVWLNGGSGTFTSGQLLPVAQTTAVALGDVNGDGDLDVVQASEEQAFVWQNNGSGVLTDGGQLSSEDNHSVALGDLDGDGDLDLFLGRGDEITNASEVWSNNGSGVFTNSGQSLGRPTRAVALGDVDGDGDLDVLAGNYNNPLLTGQPSRIWINGGAGIFSAGQILDAVADEYTEAVALGDLDGDGDLDAFLGNDNTPNWFRRNGD